MSALLLTHAPFLTVRRSRVRAHLCARQEFQASPDSFLREKAKRLESDSDGKVLQKTSRTLSPASDSARLSTVIQPAAISQIEPRHELICPLLPTPLVSANYNEKCRAAEKRGDKRVEAYKGGAVRQSAPICSKENTKASHALLKKRARKGAQLTGENSLTLVSVKPSGVAQASAPAVKKAAFSAPQDSFSLGDEEVTFVGFDGDPGTWDGIVYFNSPTENSVYQTTVDGNGVFDLSAVTVTQEIYYPPDGGDPINCDSS